MKKGFTSVSLGVGKLLQQMSRGALKPSNVLSVERAGTKGTNTKFPNTFQITVFFVPGMVALLFFVGIFKRKMTQMFRLMRIQLEALEL